jgi:CDP-diacylglycerol--serine O-phosphatidyltransferase
MTEQSKEISKSLKNEAPKQLKMTDFIVDLPNICTLVGLMSAVAGIYFAIQGDIYFAVIGGVWAVVFDWLDGLIASKMKKRTDKHRAFGAQLDSLIDIVSFGVLPAIILLSYANFNPWYLPGAFAIIGACAIRLSYFNIYGLSAGKTYTGLPVDNNGLIVSLFFLVESFFRTSIYAEVLYVLLMAVVVLNLSAINIPKFSKKVLYGIATYAIVLTIYIIRFSFFAK